MENQKVMVDASVWPFKPLTNDHTFILLSTNRDEQAQFYPWRKPSSREEEAK